MSWQDVVLAIGGFVIAAGILPTVRSPLKPPLSTSGVIFVVLAVFVLTFVTLGLWLTVVGTAVQCALWGVVIIQTFLARQASGTGLTEPVVAAPPLGFEDYGRPSTPPTRSPDDR